MERVLIIIPARYNSTRFCGKVLHPIKGKPMLQYVWDATNKLCNKYEYIDNIIATDNPKVEQVAKQFGARVIMTSKNCNSGTDRCAEVIKNKTNYKWIINLQADEPLVTAELIDYFIHNILKEKPKMASLYTNLEEESDDPNIVKVVLDEKDFAIYFSRAPIPYFRNGSPYYYQHIGIYGYERNFLLKFSSWEKGELEKIESLEQLRAIEKGVKIKMFYTKYRSIGVDTLEDVKRVEKYLELEGR